MSITLKFAIITVKRLSLKKITFTTLPWIFTVVGLYYAFRGIDWEVLFTHIGEGEPALLAAAVGFTCISYLLRARRWQSLFPEKISNFVQLAKVLFLGFFMNNILPARAGEFVRAHMGSQVTGARRTLVLATIASERLVDGITISLMFVVFALGIGNKELSTNLLWVASFFVLAGVGVLLVLAARRHVFLLADKVQSRFEHKAFSYTLDRVQVFIDGLTPLSSFRKLVLIGFWSVVIWSVELAVYISIANAFDAPLNISECVLFLVAVNFSSLIPAAPGGLGVIEAITTTVLVSIGVEKEHALTMVIAQHAIQYLVVGIPGLLVMFNWKKIIDQVRAESAEEDVVSAVGKSENAA